MGLKVEKIFLMTGIKPAILLKVRAIRHLMGATGF
jgi:hypothetical protein